MGAGLGVLHDASPIATAVAVALVAAAPSQATPTAVEQTSATSFNYALPGDAIALEFTRKAG